MSEEIKSPKPQSEKKASSSPKVKKALDPQTKKALLGVSLAGGALVALLTTALLVGSLPTASVDDGPNWTYTQPGFYGTDGNLILDSSGGSSTFFAFGQISGSFAYGILGVSAPGGSQTLVLPSSYEDETEASYDLSVVSDSAADSNVFGKTSHSDDIENLYAPSLLNSVGANAFANMAALTNVFLASDSSGRTAIGADAFGNDQKLKEAILPRNLASLGDEAFGYDPALAAALYGNASLKTIGAKAFDGCSALAEVALPSILNAIGEEAFASTSDLTSLTYGGTKKSWSAITFGANWHEGSGLSSILCADGTLTL
jgi:hypothetical protein